MTRRYKVPANRYQASFLPESIEDYVRGDNPVRVIDAYVDSLDLKLLNFQNTEETLTAGQPAFAPACLLKLYLYGYINKVRSSRCLERETHRNLEVIWLMGKLQPSYKTIADFRKNNAKAVKAANKDFILMCKELKLLGAEVIGIDGSFFNGNASKGSIYTEQKLNKQLRELEEKIEAYQEQLAQEDKNDDDAGRGSLVADPDLSKKLEQLKAKQAEKQALAKQLKESGRTQISTTDKDARLLRKRGQVTAGYNVQIAVDSQDKLIIGNEVTTDGNDTQQLSTMAIQAKETLDVEKITALADAGYYESDQLKKCEEADITAYVAIPPVRDLGRYPREAFHFDQDQNAYICPQGELLKSVGKPRKMQNKLHQTYINQPSVCAKCPKKGHCLEKENSRRTLYRWEHEEVLERHKERMKDNQKWMKLRSALAEHPFGTLKRRAGWDHFLVRGLEKVTGEFNLMVLGYNLTRVIKILGVEDFIKYLEQRNAENALNKCF